MNDVNPVIRVKFQQVGGNDPFFKKESSFSLGRLWTDFIDFISCFSFIAFFKAISEKIDPKPISERVVTAKTTSYPDPETTIKLQKLDAQLTNDEELKHLLTPFEAYEKEYGVDRSKLPAFEFEIF